MVQILLERLRESGELKNVFYLGQAVLGGLFVLIFLFQRSRGPESNFRVREADLKKPGSRKSSQTDSLSQARILSKKVHQLEGIRLDGMPHEILGIKPNCSREEVQQAYRELMKRYHPDRVGRPGSREWVDAQQIAEAINRAKDTLLAQKKS